MNNKNIGIIIGIVLSYIVLLTVIIALSINLSNLNKNDVVVEKKVSTKEGNEETVLKNIRLDEDFSTDGTIENLEGVRWNNARIMQNDGQLEVSIMLNNESKDEKIGKQNLEVTLLDKSGKKIVSKDIKIKAIDANYGYTNINFTVDMKELVIIDDIKIIANKEDTEDQANKVNTENTTDIQNVEKE